MVTRRFHSRNVFSERWLRSEIEAECRDVMSDEAEFTELVSSQLIYHWPEVGVTSDWITGTNQE